MSASDPTIETAAVRTHLHEAVSRLSALVASVCLALLAFLGGLNGVLRFFGQAVPGFYEIAGFLCAAGVGLGLGYCQLQKGHIIADFVTNAFPKKVNRALDVIGSAVSALLFAVFAWRTLIYGLSLGSNGELSETLKIPYYPVILLVAVGLALQAFALGEECWWNIAKKGGKA
jgi:TRAP-type C4-dicarboxylate transport system permease small subunit